MRQVSPQGCVFDVCSVDAREFPDAQLLLCFGVRASQPWSEPTAQPGRERAAQSWGCWSWDCSADDPLQSCPAVSSLYP